MKETETELLNTAYKRFDEEQYSEAINALKDLLTINNDHLEAKALKEQIERILKYRNTDIYSCTNLFMDPWEE